MEFRTERPKNYSNQFPKFSNRIQTKLITNFWSSFYPSINWVIILSIFDLDLGWSGEFLSDLSQISSDPMLGLNHPCTILMEVEYDYNTHILFFSTPLSFACKNMYRELWLLVLLELLLEHGADINTRDSKGHK